MGLNNYRSRSAAETLKIIDNIKYECGITRLANITGLDNVGIPVYVAMRPNSRSLSLSQGKGVDNNSAKVSALMEAIEGYHAESIEASLITSDFLSLAECGYNIIDIDGLARIKGKPFLSDKIVTWIKGYEILGKKDILIPYELVHTDYTKNDAPNAECFIVGSNGLASGNEVEEAITHALCELVERDAYSKWFQLSPESKNNTKIDIDTIECTFSQELINKLHKADILVGIWEITSDIGIPSFLVRVINSAPPPRSTALPASGFGCHPDKHLALVRAITEAAQSRLTFIAGARDDLKRSIYEEYSGGKLHDTWTSTIQQDAKRSFATIPQFKCENLYEHLISHLHDYGLKQICYVDLSKSHMPIKVVRVIIPYLRGAEDARKIDQKILQKMGEE